MVINDVNLGKQAEEKLHPPQVWKVVASVLKASVHPLENEFDDDEESVPNLSGNFLFFFRNIYAMTNHCLHHASHC